MEPSEATVKHARKYENNIVDVSSLQKQCEAEFDKTSGMAADPVVAYMKSQDLEKAIERLKSEMIAAAKRMDFIEAAQYRDEILKLQKRLEDKQTKENATT
jgi:excinuclease ABC subunit B